MTTRQWSLGPHSSMPFIARTDTRSAMDSDANTKSSCRVAVAAVRLERVERRDVLAFLRKLLRPGVSLPAVRHLGPDEPETESCHAHEDGLVAPSPVVVTVLAVPVEDVEVSGDQKLVAPAHDEGRDVGDEPMRRAIGEFSASGAADPRAFSPRARRRRCM